MKKLFILLSIIFAVTCVHVEPGLCQQKGKLKGFEDSAKGKGKKNKDKDSDDDHDYDGEDSWGSFMFSLFFDIVFETSGPDAFYSEDGQNDSLYFYEDNNQYNNFNNFWEQSGLKATYASYPGEMAPGFTSGDVGKSFLGRINGGYLPADDGLYAWHFNASAQFWYNHGVELDFLDFTEKGDGFTDHLRVFSVDYRLLMPFSNNLYFTFITGLKGFRGNTTEFGLDLGVDMIWFFTRHFNLNGKAVVTPLFVESEADIHPSLTDLSIQLGYNYKNVEFIAGYRALIPPDSGYTLDAPVLGLRFWF